MRFTRSDYTVFSVAAVVIIVFSLLFYFDFTAQSAAGQERVVGSIILARHVAQRKYASQVIWEDVEKKTPVYNHDAIRTAGQSEVVLRLTDGTELTLNENSMIILSMDTDAIDIQFRGGTLSTRRDEEGGERLGALTIRSGESTVTMKNSDLQVSSGKEEEINVTVSRGSATVASGETVQNLEERQKAVTRPGSEEIAVEDVTLVPLAPRPDAIIITPGIKAAVQFAWAPLGPETGGVLEVSTNTQFTRLVEKGRLDGSTMNAAFTPGIYYWRMKARSGKGGNTITGETRKFRIIRELPAYQIAPADGQVFRHDGRNPIIHFKWKGSDLVQTYRIDIGKEPSLERVYASYDTQGYDIAADSLRSGIYYWRVTSIIRAGGSTYRIQSKIRSLKIEKSLSLAPPQPVFPPDGDVVNRAILQRKGMVFSWDPIGNMTGCRLDVSRSMDFNKPVLTTTSKTNFINLRSKLEPGWYYWRITGIYAGKRQSAPSGIMRFRVSEVSDIRLVAPEDKGQLALEAGAHVRFSWEKADLYGEYVLQVSADRRFSEFEREAIVNDSYAYASGFKPGTYYWRVIMKNPEGDMVLSSTSHSFTVQDVLSEPVILSPRNGAIFNFKNIDELDLSWKRLKEANLYKIRFYRMEKNRAVFIAERDIGNTPLEIDDINFLGEGKILWSIQAFETADKGKRIVRKSPISRAYFEVRIPQERKKIKFLTPKVLYTE